MSDPTPKRPATDTGGDVIPPIHTVEVLQAWRSGNRYNPAAPGPEYWLRRRVRVPGGWLYETRTLALYDTEGTYRQSAEPRGIASAFVPDPPGVVLPEGYDPAAVLRDGVRAHGRRVAP